MSLYGVSMWPKGVEVAKKLLDPRFVALLSMHSVTLVVKYGTHTFLSAVTLPPRLKSIDIHV